MSECDRCRTSLWEAASWPAADAADHLRACASCRSLAAALAADQETLRQVIARERVPEPDLEDVLGRTRRQFGAGQLLVPAVAMAAVLVVGWISRLEPLARLPGTAAVSPAATHATQNPFRVPESNRGQASVFEPRADRLVNPFGTPEPNPFFQPGALGNPFHVASLDQNPFTPEDGDVLAVPGIDARRY